MNVTLKAADTAKSANGAASVSAMHPRIRYMDPLALGGPEAIGPALARTASLGFDTVLVPPPFVPGASGDRFAPAALDKAHPGLGGGDTAAYLRGFTRACRQHGLRPMLDLPLATLAAEFVGDASPFRMPPTTATCSTPARPASPSFGVWPTRRHSAPGGAAMSRIGPKAESKASACSG